MTDQNNQPQPQRLNFENEPGSSQSKWLATILSLALIGWMSSGYIFPSSEAKQANPDTTTKTISVMVRQSQAQDITKTFIAEGQAQPDRKATILAQAGGEIISLFAKKGDMLNANQKIAQIKTRDLDARLLQAKQELYQSQKDYDAAQTLFKKGVATAARLREADAQLASSKTLLTQAEEALNSATIKAPFAGRLNTLVPDIGSYVSVGSEIGTIFDTDPLRIIIDVPQQSISQMSQGQQATIDFITGETRQGTIDYISRDADKNTRTFRTEITVPNPEGQIPSGLSVKVKIPTQTIKAHFISPAILSLNEDGILGIKTIEDTNRVAFHAITIEQAQKDGIWVSGLPQTATLITVGQGYVDTGETVNPMPENTSSSSKEEPNS